MEVLAASLPALHLHLPPWMWALITAIAVVSVFERIRRADRRARHRAYLRSPEWRRRRDAALARAHWQCEDCGRPERLRVHHLTDTSWGHEAAEDLRVLCPRCRAQRHPQLVLE